MNKKRKVGRPSNKEIQRRKNEKIISILMLVFAIGFVGFGIRKFIVDYSYSLSAAVSKVDNANIAIVSSNRNVNDKNCYSDNLEITFEDKSKKGIKDIYYKTDTQKSYIPLSKNNKTINKTKAKIKVTHYHEKIWFKVIDVKNNYKIFGSYKVNIKSSCKQGKKNSTVIENTLQKKVQNNTNNSTKIDITKAHISSIKNKKYIGSHISPEPNVIMNKEILKKDVDYKYSYKNNINVGNGEVIITGIGKYQGSKSITFKIVENHAVIINKKELALKSGEKHTLTAQNIEGDKITNNIIWKTSNSKVAIVKNGEVTARNPGKAAIYAITNDKYKKRVKCIVTVSSNKEETYVMPEDSKYSSYSNVVAYNSETLKYRIINYNGYYIALIWTEDGYNQLNGALAYSNAQGVASAETILNNEINTYGYSNKGMIAINASFFSNSSPQSNVVLNKNSIVKNSGSSAALIGVDSNGYLNQYINKTASEISSYGVHTTFVESSTAAADPSSAVAERTQICQYDRNNFVILSGTGTVSGSGETIRNLTGCTTTYNLDGGGSRKLYYKKNNTGITRLAGGSRALPDMLYIVEK